MIIALGLLLFADVGLHVEQITDAQVEETVRPLLHDLALAVEARTGGQVIAQDPALRPCARGEPGCVIRPDPSVDEVLCVRLVGGVRKILVLIERVRVEPPLVISSTRVELEQARERWKEPFWTAARALFPEIAPPILAPSLEPPPEARGMRAEHWVVVGGGGAAVVVGALLTLDGALTIGRLERGEATTSVEGFMSASSRASVERTLGGALLAAGLTAAAMAVVAAWLPAD